MKKFSPSEKEQLYLYFRKKISLYYIRNFYYKPGMGGLIEHYYTNDILIRTERAFNFYIEHREAGEIPNDIIIEALSILFANLQQDETTFFRD